MSGTPEYYFQQRWLGMENLGKIVGERSFSNKRNSVELSLGERLSHLNDVTVSILACSGEIRDAILDKTLTEDALLGDLDALEARVKQATDALQNQVEEVLSFKRSLQVTIANYKTIEAWESLQQKDT
jgi:hypothetical protein